MKIHKKYFSILSRHLQRRWEKFMICLKVWGKGDCVRYYGEPIKMKTDKRRYYALARYSLLAISFSISTTIALIGMPKALLIR